MVAGGYWGDGTAMLNTDVPSSTDVSSPEGEMGAT